MSRKTLKRKLLVNLALLAAAALLAALAFYEPGRDEPETPPPLTGLAQDRINRVAIHRPGEPDVVLARDETGWRLIAPRELPANGGRVENLLALANAESRRQYAAADLDPEQVGLGERAPRVTLDDTEFAFGATDPINGWRYVQVGDSVHLTRDGFIHLVRQEPLYWADNRLLPGDAAITALHLPDVRVQRDAEGLWRSEPPADAGADALVSLVQYWVTARALSVKALDGDVPGDAPAVRVELAGEPGPLEFRLMETDDGIFLARPDLELRYAITAAQREDLMGAGLRAESGDAPEAADGEPGADPDGS